MVNYQRKTFDGEVPLAGRLRIILGLFAADHTQEEARRK